MIRILMYSKISKWYFQLGMTDDRSYSGLNRPPWMKEIISVLENIEGFNQDYSKHGDGATAIANFINAGRDLSYILDTIRNPVLSFSSIQWENERKILYIVAPFFITYLIYIHIILRVGFNV